MKATGSAFRSGEYSDPVARSPEDLICHQDYLGEISSRYPSSTARSHRNSVRSFTGWLQNRCTEGEPVPQALGEFLIENYSDCELSPDTVGSHLIAIANYAGYEYGVAPDLVKYRTLRYLVHKSGFNADPLVDCLGGPLRSDRSPNGWLESGVEGVIRRLRRSKAGTRVHAFTELTLETKGHPLSTRQIDLKDLELCENRVCVQIPGQYAVSEHGLLEKWTVEISTRAVDILNEYLDQARKEPEIENCRPLFTTNCGRVSRWTINRSIKRVAEAVKNRPGFWIDNGRLENTEATDATGKNLITAQDLWWFAVRSVEV